MSLMPGIGFVCSSSDMHPYECGGGCVHCKMEKKEGHDPDYCYLCHDGNPPKKQAATPTPRA